MVRDSTNFVGDFTLCVSFQSKVEHYRIIAGRAQNTNKKNYTIDEDEYFDDLISLVRHYRYDVLFQLMDLDLLLVSTIETSFATKETCFKSFTKKQYIYPRAN